MAYSFFHDEEHEDNKMIKVEVNLDDISGEWLGYVMDLLFEVGANDVFYTPIYMKKNRPGVMVQILCDIEKLKEIEKILFTETTTLGIRYYPLTVHRLERKFSKIMTQWGEVTIKKGLYKGNTVQYSPEYEECRSIAKAYNVPLKTVFNEIWSKMNI